LLGENDISTLSLVIPNTSHEDEYCRVMDKWDMYHEKVQPPSMRRYADRESFSFSKWLANCEDDRTSGSMLRDHIPCTFSFLVNGSNKILGGFDINHANTHRGHVHAGIVPWHRGKGYGTAMLTLGLAECKNMGMGSVYIAPRKDNYSAIQTIMRNGGVLTEEFLDSNIVCVRYEIKLC
jgi:predicted acetyltransferase